MVSASVRQPRSQTTLFIAMITRHEKELKKQEEKRKQEAMKIWNQKTLRMNQKKIGEERRLRELQRQKLEETMGTQEEEKKQKQLEEKRLRELHRQKMEEFRKTQEKLKEERDRKFQENERRKKEMLRKKQEETAKLREEEKMRREHKKKLAEEQRDQEEQRRIDEEMGRWRREENNRRSKEEMMKVTINDQVKLESQRQRVEEVMRMSRELAFNGGAFRDGAENCAHSKEENANSTPPARTQAGSAGEETFNDNQQDQHHIGERSQQEQEQESRREAQEARHKRYQEERQCTTLEDDLQKLIQKASALATLVDDAESIGTSDELDSLGSYEGRRDLAHCLRDNSTKEKGEPGYARKNLPLCADGHEGMTYLYDRLEEKRSKQLVIKKPSSKKSRPKKVDLLPKHCGLPYSKSLGTKAPRGVLEPIPFLKFDGSPCFGHGPARNYVIRR
ncbi:hypothetical protein MPTK1_8g16770 [Marchantia polymorpha subsp. ruderalis]|uniref:Uncharacterized protein n=1 Tax=Marchantia polymorpha TaxID=3197 RepID=A0A2R6X834_MARPO|nr:hypothetical protein MARPO_0030s0010 [Marchantia polymorpha]BBN20143.1 hypothetical protein Mp_8g16770 [Marchantia polymorpha subsp. ruderalis]|eukprot:PTQ42257.1 hypothetical protein MARPO_0030s0010 [Marchantia polymorpha]